MAVFFLYSIRWVNCSACEVNVEPEPSADGKPRNVFLSVFSGELGEAYELAGDGSDLWNDLEHGLSVD